MGGCRVTIGKYTLRPFGIQAPVRFLFKANIVEIAGITRGNTNTKLSLEISPLSSEIYNDFDFTSRIRENNTRFEIGLDFTRGRRILPVDRRTKLSEKKLEGGFLFRRDRGSRMPFNRSKDRSALLVSLLLPLSKKTTEENAYEPS